MDLLLAFLELSLCSELRCSLILKSYWVLKYLDFVLLLYSDTESKQNDKEEEIDKENVSPFSFFYWEKVKKTLPLILNDFFSKVINLLFLCNCSSANYWYY